MWRAGICQRVDEAVTLAGDVDDVSHSIHAVHQDPPERSDLRAQAALIDTHAFPDLGHEFLLGYYLAGIPDQQEKDVQGSASQLNRLALPGEPPFGGEQPERSELGIWQRRRS